MGILDSIVTVLLGPLGVAGAVLQEEAPLSPPVDDSTTPADVAAAKRFLVAEAAILGGIVAAPAAYALYTGTKKRKSAKKRKQEEKVLTELSHASTRVTSLLSSFGPAFAIPATYITVQQMENGMYISKGLGDAVQTLLTTSAAAGLVGGIAGIALPFLKK